MIRILFASRLVQEKGVDILIDCIEEFSQDEALSREISWTICSDGTEEALIQELSQKYIHVSYLGKVGQEELEKLYRENDILFMPSRFLEIFWLTALEAWLLWLPVCAPNKGWLRDLVSLGLILDETDCVESFRIILLNCLKNGIPAPRDVSRFSPDVWKRQLQEITENVKNIGLIHDYKERIGWAEYYILSLGNGLKQEGKRVEFFWYSGHTSIWKRRILFVFSIFAFWRGIRLARFLQQEKPDMLWMHSILRYIWPWWVLAIRQYTKQYNQIAGENDLSSLRLILSHHDLGLLAAFPQDITEESEIPKTSRLKDFIPKNWSLLKKVISIPKWCYVRIITLLLPTSTTQMIFSDFLRQPILEHFWENTQIILFPHTSMIGTLSSKGEHTDP